MRIIFKPFALIASLIAVRLGKGMFKSLWARVDDGDPPDPTAPNASLGKVVGAAALEAATLASMAALADRAAARVFEYLTGVWPGKKPEEKGKEQRGR